LLVPSILAGAVEQGTVSATLSWGGAALVGGMVAAVVFFVRHPRRHDHRRNPDVGDASHA
jgi:hypothetical protein